MRSNTFKYLFILVYISLFFILIFQNIDMRNTINDLSTQKNKLLNEAALMSDRLVQIDEEQRKIIQSSNLLADSLNIQDEDRGISLLSNDLNLNISIESYFTGAQKADLFIDNYESLIKFSTYLYETNEKNKKLLAAIPSIMPANGYFSSFFGYRFDPFTNIKKLHKGLDIAAPFGSPVVATANGKVLLAQKLSSYGNTVRLSHKFGYESLYAHMSKIIVKKGDKVKRGQIIGYVGHSGRAHGTHLHYEVIRDKKHLDPQKFILDDTFFVIQKHSNNSI